MKFDKSRVYTAQNADELKVGSKVIVADSLQGLKDRLNKFTSDEDHAICIGSILPETEIHRFKTTGGGTHIPLPISFLRLKSLNTYRFPTQKPRTKQSPRTADGLGIIPITMFPSLA